MGKGEAKPKTCSVNYPVPFCFLMTCASFEESLCDFGADNAIMLSFFESDYHIEQRGHMTSTAW